jgi:16S rRNA (cytosine1402-N4)-methyltransferase
MDRPAHGHEPVMMPEVLQHLDPQPGQTVVDCTVGRGGHSVALATAVAPGGTLIGLDYDPRNLAFAGERLAGLPARLFHANFTEIDDALEAAGVEQVDGILADLGISTNQLFDEPYGLSFTVDQPLDMRLDPRTRVSAHAIVNTWREEDIANALFRLADERYSRRIARKIVETRRQTPIETTGHLAELVRTCVPPTRARDRAKAIDPATRTFLALRMAVNGEMSNLERLLKVAPDLLKPGGKLAILTFHSTEDRLVKHAFRSAEQTGRLSIVTPRPLSPSPTEIDANPRARSAKLRVAMRPARSV